MTLTASPNSSSRARRDRPATGRLSRTPRFAFLHGGRPPDPQAARRAHGGLRQALPRDRPVPGPHHDPDPPLPSGARLRERSGSRARRRGPRGARDRGRRGSRRRGAARGSPPPRRRRADGEPRDFLPPGPSWSSSSRWSRPARRPASRPRWARSRPVSCSARATTSTRSPRRSRRSTTCSSTCSSSPSGCSWSRRSSVSHPAEVVAGVLVLVSVKAVAAFAALRAAGTVPRTAVRAALALANVGEFSKFVLATTGAALGSLAGDARQTVVAATVGTLVLAPFLVAAGPSFAVRLPEAVEDPGEGETSPRARHIVVVGAALVTGRTSRAHPAGDGGPLRARGHRPRARRRGPAGGAPRAAGRRDGPRGPESPRGSSAPSASS